MAVVLIPSPHENISFLSMLHLLLIIIRLLEPILPLTTRTPPLRNTTLPHDLDILTLIRLQVIGEIAFFRAFGRCGGGELVHVAFGVVGFGGGGLVGFEFAEVEVLY